MKRNGGSKAILHPFIPHFHLCRLSFLFAIILPFAYSFATLLYGSFIPSNQMRIAHAHRQDASTIRLSFRQRRLRKYLRRSYASDLSMLDFLPRGGHRGTLFVMKHTHADQLEPAKG